MGGSANLSSDESVRKLAFILAIAPNLKKCNIKGQGGNRKVFVVVEYAEDGRRGAVVMKDKETDQEICRRETVKQEAEFKYKMEFKQGKDD